MKRKDILYGIYRKIYPKVGRGIDFLIGIRKVMPKILKGSILGFVIKKI